jgi:hypothetical protein
MLTKTYSNKDSQTIHFYKVYIQVDLGKFKQNQTCIKKT